MKKQSGNLSNLNYPPVGKCDYISKCRVDMKKSGFSGYQVTGPKTPGGIDHSMRRLGQFLATVVPMHYRMHAE